jgi:hypothetical protein
MAISLPHTGVYNGADPVVLVNSDGTPTSSTGSNPATIYADQQVVTASAVALTAQALVNGLVITAKSTNAGNVFVGGATVTTTDDGSGNGYRLLPGQSINYGVTNASAIYIIGTLNDVVYVAGN